MVKIILLVVGGFIALILIVAALMKKEYTISSEIVINKPKAEVFNFLKNIKNQEKYSKWVMADPNVKLTYTGTDGRVGFISAWDSQEKNVGAGAQEIMKIAEGAQIDMELRFEKPFKMVSKAVTTTESVGENQTKYTNIFFAKSPYPLNIMYPIMKKMLGKDMDETSANLKKLLETN